jgi:ketosteroid isomerase-like protein
MESGKSQVSIDSVLEAIGLERRAVESGDAKLYFSVLTDDAIFLPPNSHAKQGAELRAWLRAFLDGFRVEWLSFVSTEVLLAGETAYHAYTYSWRTSPRVGSDPTVATGKGVHLLYCQPDGSWKIAREIWNASPAKPQ